RPSENQRRTNYKRSADTPAENCGGNEHRGDAYEEIEQGESPAVRGAGHSNLFQHVGVDDRSRVKGETHVEEIEEPKGADQFPAEEGLAFPKAGIAAPRSRICDTLSHKGTCHSKLRSTNGEG